MAQQVKFYSMASLPATPNAGGVYFVDDGELYKGSQRFGLGRVTVAESTDGVTGAARGDIVVTGAGAGWVYDGNGWQSIGGDVGSLTSAWRSDISASLSGLAAGGAGSYITGITQNADGSVTANASTFQTDVWTAIGNGAVSGTANGITVSVTTTSGVVTSVEVAAANISATSVSAETGTFENLTVTDTATFSATTISADTLTISGSTVEQLADKQIAAIAASTVTSTATGITVSVTTQGGSVTAVSLNAESFANAMHFLGVGTVEKTASGVDVTPPAGKTPVAGDIVIDSESGLEAICTGTDPSTTWELIGDNTVYALNAYSSTATVYANAGVETVPAALNAVGAAIGALTSKTDAYVGGADSSAASGITASVAIASSTMAPTVELAVDTAALSTALGLGDAASKNVANTLDASATTLPTCSAVASYVSTTIGDLDSEVSTDENSNVSVTVTQVDGVLTSVSATLTWITEA